MACGGAPMTEPAEVAPTTDMAREVEPVLWTAWCDYFATGEGRSVMACIAYANEEAEIKKHFAKKFDDWYAIGCEAAKGVVRNEYTTFLWSRKVLRSIEMAEKKAGWVDAHSWVHVNFS